MGRMDREKKNALNQESPQILHVKQQSLLMSMFNRQDSAEASSKKEEEGLRRKFIMSSRKEWKVQKNPDPKTR